MMKNKANEKLVVIAALVAVIIGYNQVCAIDCYECDSSDADCVETIDGASLLAKGKVVSGCGACGKVFQAIGTVWSKVQRTCTTGSDMCEERLGWGQCICTTTLCNGHPYQFHSMFVILVLFACIVITNVLLN